jgi:hypothetical protein
LTPIRAGRTALVDLNNAVDTLRNGISALIIAGNAAADEDTVEGKALVYMTAKVDYDIDELADILDGIRGLLGPANEPTAA